MTSISKSRPFEQNDFGKNPFDPRKQQLRAWMEQCRQLTLNLFSSINQDTFCYQAHPDFSPIGWHLGHIAYTEALWLLEHQAGYPPQFPEYRRLFAADSLPKGERINLPTLAEVCKYLDTVRSQVFDYLKIAPIHEQERLWLWLLQHESQHSETIALVLALQKKQNSSPDCNVSTQSNETPKHPQFPLLQQHPKSKIVRLSGSTEAHRSAHAEVQNPTSNPICFDSVKIPAGYFEMGNQSLDALDNERPVQQVYLDTYWIDPYPVTCGQYRIFMEAHGYQDRQWWSPEGWQWLQTHPATQPTYWSQDPRWENHPVCGVSWYEAEAYANFVGKRLPTEAEWEKAASWQPIQHQRLKFPWGSPPWDETLPGPDTCNHNHHLGHTTPVNAYPMGVSPYGCYDLLGNVWEWTSSWFDGYVGFNSYPYPGYSQTYFDQQHRVLRGGSWATRPWALRCAFRNWYQPHMREMLAGFRCAIAESDEFDPGAS